MDELMKEINAIHLFSGINAPEALVWRDKLPINFIGTAEINPKAIAIQKKNFPDLPCYGGIADVIERKDLGKIDLAIAGSSCQSFSVNGDRKGLEGSSGIVKEFWRFLKVHQPRFFLWENVSSVTKPSNRGTLEQILAAFTGKLEFEENPQPVNYWCSKKGDRGWAIASTEVGYNLAWLVINAKSTSPQNRERIYMIGCKDIPPLSILGAMLSQYIAVTASTPAAKKEYEGELNLENHLAYSPKLDFSTYIKHPENPEYLSAKALEKIWEKNHQKTVHLTETIAWVAKEMADAGGKPIKLVNSPWAMFDGLKEDFMCCFEETTRRLLSPSNWKVSGQRLTTPCLTVGDASAESERGEASKGRSGSKKLAIFYVEGGYIKARRITLEETETLQGFPPGWTAAEGLADGSRRRLIGNSMALSSLAIAMKAICQLSEEAVEGVVETEDLID